MIRQQFDVGDLVEIDLPYPTKKKRSTIGVVTETRLINAHMTEPGLYKWHPDEYTCLVRALGDDIGRWVRAKHLKTVSKANVRG